MRFVLSVLGAAIRSAVRARGGPDQYERDLRTLTTGHQRQHLEDLKTWLSTDFTIRDLAADVALPSTELIVPVMDVITRGRAELRQLVDRAASG
ncbi:hypothetical protein GCM10009741_58620 [Kribbella lupini]|uniref:Uncharacterized protein n=1 Tax=Kribbella lupini TaxID=291602 RepID=A0ABP4MMJ3_9ACTN